MGHFVSVDVAIDDIHDDDLVESLENRGYAVIDPNSIEAINTALNLGDKRTLIEALDDLLLVHVSPSFEEVFFPDEE